MAIESIDTDEQEFSNKLLAEVQSDDLDLIALLGEHATAIEQDLDKTKQELETSRTQMEEIWENDQNDSYELSSVFIHLGAAGYGHYYCGLVRHMVIALTHCSHLVYQRALPSQPDRWLKFNDSTVSAHAARQYFACSLSDAHI